MKTYFKNEEAGSADRLLEGYTLVTEGENDPCDLPGRIDAAETVRCQKTTGNGDSRRGRRDLG